MLTKGNTQAEDDTPTRFEAAVTSPHFGTAIAAFGIVTGLLGSVYPDQLLGLVAWLPPVAGAWLFVAFALATALAVFMRQRVVDRRRELVQRRFDAAAEEIPELIRTLPDPAFLTHLGTLYRKHVLLVADIGDDDEQRIAAVQLTLRSLATLAQKFDGRESQSRYAANLMVFVPAAEMSTWMPLLQFYDNDPQKLRGLLVLSKNFAAVVDGHDDSLSEFALPVPETMGQRRDANGKGLRVLPGAPMAYHTEQLEHFKNAAELASWCDAQCDLTEQVRSDLREHFVLHAAQIGGFLSVAVCSPRDEHVIGVLNVHWDSSWRLSDPHAAQLFKEATFPLQVILAQMLEELVAAGAVPRPGAPTVSPPAPQPSVVPGSAP